MSLRLLFILPILLISTEIVFGQDAPPAAEAPKPAAAPAAKPAAAAPAPKPTQKENEAKGEEEKKKDEKGKMKVGGGLYTTDKVATIKSLKGNHPVSIF